MGFCNSMTLDGCGCLGNSLAHLGLCFRHPANCHVQGWIMMDDLSHLLPRAPLLRCRSQQGHPPGLEPWPWQPPWQVMPCLHCEAKISSARRPHIVLQTDSSSKADPNLDPLSPPKAGRNDSPTPRFQGLRGNSPWASELEQGLHHVLHQAAQTIMGFTRVNGLGSATSSSAAVAE